MKISNLITLSVFIGIFTFKSFGQCFNTANDFKQYYKTNLATIDPIEGLWSASRTVKIYRYNSLIDTKYESQVGEWAIIKDGDNYKSCNPYGEKIDVKIDWTPTATKGVYLYKKTYLTSYNIVKANAVLSSGLLLKYSFEENDNELRRNLEDKYVDGLSFVYEFEFIKTYPSSDDYKFASPSPSSGTGYAISSNGCIVTNHHVTNGATSIKIRGVNGDFSKTYTAKVIVEDKNNDLSIIKIDDQNFTSLGTIPYIIANRASDVGSSVFVLGYPLRATMGDEVKLTNGIISSKSGFQGDVTSYQITAPIQPGNSGGPLFDDKGSIIGIINAKHVGAENASYAIKASYLMNLIDLMPTPPKLSTISTVAGKPLTEQVKILKKFTYIIEINQ